MQASAFALYLTALHGTTLHLTKQNATVLKWRFMIPKIAKANLCKHLPSLFTPLNSTGPKSTIRESRILKWTTLKKMIIPR